MNFDPYDSVAWRSFGMLNDEERALFEDAMRHDPGLRRACHEMDRLTAAIAASAVAPVQPEASEIDRLRRNLGLPHAGRKAPLWLALGGWATALAMAAIAARLAWFEPSTPESMAPQNTAPETAPRVAPQLAKEVAQPEEIRRLMQEIDDLRKALEEFQQRDRALFQVLPGRALQTVMIMIPPGSNPADAGTLATPAMLGDALAAINNRALDGHQEQMIATTEEVVLHQEQNQPETEIAPLPEDPQPTGPPLAIPIYDAARDAGTLVVSNLPPAAVGKAYHLWVATSAGARPVFLGMLPERSAAGAESFDFSLGSSMILPLGFVLTMDAPGSPTTPSETNTVLSGPPAAR